MCTTRLVRAVQWICFSVALLAHGCRGADDRGGPFTTADGAVHPARDASPGEGEGGAPSVADAAAPDASTRDAGQTDSATELPSIVSIEPMRVARREQIFIRGMHLDAVSEVRIAGLSAEVLSISATGLEVRVPPDAPGDDCEVPADVVVEAEGGSASGKLILVRPGPIVTELDGSDVRAGENVVMRGSRLADARVTLNDVELMVIERSDESLTIAIPLDGPRGAATLTVTGMCDHTSLTVGVLPPLPHIVAIDQTTLAPNGVTRITFDMEKLSELLGVRVGDGWVPVYAASHYLWFPAEEGSRLRTVAVRMPADLAQGKLNLTLVGQFSESLPVFVQGVLSAPTHPDPPFRVLWPAAAAYNDTTYPIGSVPHAFHPSQRNPNALPDSAVHWSYELSFEDSGGTGSCKNEGVLSGLERHCVACTLDTLGCSTAAGDVCHPISGHYRLDSKEDLVEIDVDRTSTGGSVEHYVGGWASYRGDPPGTENNAWSGYNLVLRSVHSGLQLAIDHLLADRVCNRSLSYRPVRPRRRTKRRRLRRRPVSERKLVLPLSLFAVACAVQACSTNQRAGHDATDAASMDMNPVQGSADAGSAAPDAQSSDDGEVIDAGRELPVIASLEPERVARGEQIVIAGRHLQTVDQVRIDGVAGVVLGGSKNRLVVQVPTKIPGKACETPVGVVVEAQAGASEPFPLTLLRRAPTVTGFDGTDVRSGASFAIVGTNLEDAQVSLGDTKLSVEERSASALRVAVPDGTSRGEAQLSVTGTCGGVSLAVSVLPPLPRILSVDQLTLAPNGVTHITFVMDQPAELRGIRVGKGWVSAHDPKYCGWLPSSDGSSTRTIAVRMPADMPLGVNSLSLEGLFGQSSPFTVRGVEAPPVVPFPPVRVLWPASQAFDDGTFPVGTTTPFHLGEEDPDAPPDPTRGWSYYLSFYGTNSGSCEGEGSVSGMERHCVGGCTPFSYTCSPDLGDACHPLSGTFRLGSDINQVEIDIDRSSTGGLPQPEHFVGGWVSPDGITPPGSWADIGDQRLVLRSTYSGLQLDIVHWVESCGGY